MSRTRHDKNTGKKLAQKYKYGHDQAQLAKLSREYAKLANDELAVASLRLYECFLEAAPQFVIKLFYLMTWPGFLESTGTLWCKKT